MTMKKSAPTEAAPGLIDARIRELGDWRGRTLARVREVIRKADPGVVETLDTIALGLRRALGYRLPPEPAPR